MKKLCIPERITLEKQYVPGLGKRELRRLTVTALPGLCLSVCLFLCLPSPGARLGALLAGFLFCGACYGLFVRVDGTLSIYTYLTRILAFHRAQKRYYYKHEKEEVYHAQENEP